MEIESSTGSYYGEGMYLVWSAIEDGETIGALHVHPDTLVIMNVEVDEDRQGEGIARRLYETAAATIAIKHAPEWGCTPEGLGFARAMGGAVASDADMARMGITAPDTMED